MPYTKTLSAYTDIEAVLAAASLSLPASYTLANDKDAVRWLGRANYYRRLAESYTELSLRRVGNVIAIDSAPRGELRSGGAILSVHEAPDFAKILGEK